jgi:hypothetical protein
MLKILEVLIGLALVYFVYAVLISALVEGLSSRLMLRGHFLQLGILKLLGIDYKEKSEALIWKSIQILESHDRESNSSIGKAICNHPFLTSSRLQGDQGAWQSYLPSQQFSAAVIDSLLSLDKNKQLVVNSSLNMAQIRQSVESLSDGHLKASLRTLLLHGEQTISEFDLKVQNWFNLQMDRTSGWYKKWVKLITLLMGFLIAGVINLDVIELTAHLWSNDKTRNEFVNLAESYTKLDIAEAKSFVVQEFTLPIGWIDISNRFGFQSLIACKNKNSNDCLKNQATEQAFHLKLANDLEQSKLQYAVCLSTNAKEIIDIKTTKLTDDQKRQMNIICDPFTEQIKELTKQTVKLGDPSLKSSFADSPNKELYASYFILVILKFFGFLLSALLVLPGAQFWFDSMKGLLKLRTSLKPDDAATRSSTEK